MASSNFRSPDPWGTQSETQSTRGNFNYRVMGVGNDLLRDFISQNITSTSNQSVMDRLMRYQLYWNFYNGRHWKDFNEAFLSFNYVKAFIDKVIFFMSGKEGITFQIRDLEEDAIINAGNLKEDDAKYRLARAAEKVILKNWNRNSRRIFTQELLQMGSVFGDAYVVLSYDTAKKYVRYNLIDSRFGFVKREYGENNDEDIVSFQIRQPLDKNENDYILKITEYQKKSWRTYYLKSTEDEADRYDVENGTYPYDFIPVVHIRNKPNLGSFYSYSDVENLLSLNKTYNEMNMLIKEIIDYHATPTTVITGANAKSLRRGLGRMWSGLPSDANVFNLTLDTDLSAAMQFTERLKTAMHEFAEVPENTLGQLQPISNTSGAALELTYQPLIQQSDNKRLMYSEGIKRINYMTIEIMKARGHNDPLFRGLPADFNEKYEVEPVWTYGLPKDRMNELNMADIELRLGLGTRKEIMRRLGKSNVDDLIKEIDAEIEKYGKFGGENNNDGNSNNNDPKPNSNQNGNNTTPNQNASSENGNSDEEE